MKKVISILSTAIIGLSAVPFSYASESAEDTVIVSESTENIDWLPITMNDYEAFIAKYGVVSVHDKYIVYCDAVNYSTGDSVIMEQAGTAEIKKVKEYSITTDEPLPPGSKSYVVYVYESVSAGTVEITISQSRTWDSNAPKDIKSTGFYKVDNNMTITVTDKLDVDNFKKGDVNMDGAFNVSDVVLLQKWLLAEPDVTLNIWKAADLCEDGTLNIFDLCLLKKELLNDNNNLSSAEPVPFTILQKEWVYLPDEISEYRNGGGFVTTSLSDLQKLIQEKQIYINENSIDSLVEFESEYENYNILALYTKMGATSRIISIDSIDKVDDTLTVSFTTIDSIYATPDMKSQLMLIKIDKAISERISNITINNKIQMKEMIG